MLKARQFIHQQLQVDVHTGACSTLHGARSTRCRWVAESLVWIIELASRIHHAEHWGQVQPSSEPSRRITALGKGV
jgi:hypothetical protein